MNKNTLKIHPHLMPYLQYLHNSFHISPLRKEIVSMPYKGIVRGNATKFSIIRQKNDSKSLNINNIKAMNKINLNKSSALNTQSCLLTPLELINLYLSDGKSIGPKENKLYQKFNRELSWDSMLNHGYQADLAPLLSYILTKTDFSHYAPGTMHSSNTNQTSQINEEVMLKLKTLYNHQLVRNLIQFHELENILNVFEKKGIDVIQLKGAELAKNYYPEQSLRPMADIDLLVRNEDMKRAKGCLTNLKYEFKVSKYFDDEDSYERVHFHFPFIKHTSFASTLIELHQDIAAESANIKNNILEFWENALVINNNYKHILTIPVEFLLLHLFWHTYLNLYEHLNMRMLWLLDIVYTINKHRDIIDWMFLEKKAKEWKIQKQVYFCLYLLNQIFNMDSINNIRTLIPSNHSVKIFNFTILNIKNDMQILHANNRFLMILLYLLSLNTISERIQLLFKYNYYANPLSKIDWIKKKYGCSSKVMSFLYTIIHPIIQFIDVLNAFYKILQNRN